MRCGVSQAMLCWAIALLLACGIAVPASSETLTEVPFDTSLSIYVGHDGTWMNYASGLDEEEEIEDPVAAFAPGEQMSDDPDVWGAHQINLPEPPQGWVFFDPVETETMELHVVIQDTQNRLGEVEITNYDTGGPVGTLEANAQGSEIDGTVVVDPSCEDFRLEVTNLSGTAVLLQAGARNAKVDDAFGVAVPFAFEPNRGQEHQCWYVTGGLGPWGSPLSVDGKVSTEMSAWATACMGPCPFNNDNEQVLAVPPATILDDKQMPLNGVTWPAPGLALKAMQSVGPVVTGIWARYDGGQRVFPDYSAPPYSKGTAHFPCEVQGELYAIVYVPYSGKEIHKGTIAPEVTGTIFSHRSEAAGTSDPAGELAAKVVWTIQEKTKWQVGSVVALGNVWGLMGRSSSAPAAMDLEGFTAEVTFELWADKAPPAPGAPGRVGGTGTALRDTAFTTPAPPAPMDGNLVLNFPSDGENKGLCVVELAKGWKWKATARPFMLPYTEGEVGPVEVRGPITERINTQLTALMTLKVKTVSSDNPPTNTPAQVELQKQTEGGGWIPYGNGQSTEQPGGEYVWTTGGLAPGMYQVRAKAIYGMGSPWSDWQQFPVIPDIEMTRTVTVTIQQMMGGW